MTRTQSASGTRRRFALAQACCHRWIGSGPCACGRAYAPRGLQARIGGKPRALVAMIGSGAHKEVR